MKIGVATVGGRVSLLMLCLWIPSFAATIGFVNGLLVDSPILDSTGTNMKIIRRGKEMQVQKSLIAWVTDGKDTVKYGDLEPSAESVIFDETPEGRFCRFIDTAKVSGELIPEGTVIEFQPIPYIYDGDYSQSINWIGSLETKVKKHWSLTRISHDSLPALFFANSVISARFCLVVTKSKMVPTQSGIEEGLAILDMKHGTVVWKVVKQLTVKSGAGSVETKHVDGGVFMSGGAGASIWKCSDGSFGLVANDPEIILMKRLIHDLPTSNSSSDENTDTPADTLSAPDKHL